MHAYYRITYIRYFLHYSRYEFVKFFRCGITHCVRNIHYLSSCVYHSFYYLAQVIYVRPRCIFSRKFHVRSVFARIFHCCNSHIQNLFSVFFEFIFQMNIRSSYKSVNPWLFSILYRFPRCIYIIEISAGKRCYCSAFYFLRYSLYCFKVTWRCNRKSCFYDINP